MSETPEKALPTKLELVPLSAYAPNVLTSYGPKMQTADPGGRMWRREQLKPVTELPHWQSSRATAEDLALLAEACDREGLDFRLTEAFRSPREQAIQRSMYDAWRSAGSPRPDSSRFSNTKMRTTYVAPPGRSNHGWGGAFDLHIGALCPNGKTANATLARFWEVAEAFGFKPILARPWASASEAWHFDHIGGLAAVRKMYESRPAYAPDAYGHVAEIGATLALTHQDGEMDRGRWRQVQAWLALAGFFPGAPDGLWGKLTAAACEEAGLQLPATGKPDPLQLLGQITRLGLGRDKLEGI